MDAKTLVVEHGWDSAKTGEVVSVASRIIQSAESGKLPAGANLLEVNLSEGGPKGILPLGVREQESLEGILASVNPPTRHSVAEFDLVHGTS